MDIYYRDKERNTKTVTKHIVMLHIKCKFLSESNVLHTVMLLLKLSFNFDKIVVLQ
jgi:hypothetical protein